MTKNNRGFRLLALLPILLLFINAGESPVELYKKGKKAYFDEDYDRAVYYLKSSLQANPNYIEPLIELSHVYYDLKNYDYAFNYISKAMHLYPDNAEYIIFSADIETRLERYSIAEGKYKKIIEQDPLNMKAFSGLANLYLITNRKILAKNTLDGILKNEPANFMALLLMARYYEEFNSSKAESYYIKNVQQNSLNADSYFFYSLFNFRENRVNKAIENIKTAIKIRPKLEYKLFYGKYLLYVNRGDEALANFKEILKSGSVDYLNYYHLANAYYLVSGNSRAVVNLDKAMALRDDDEISAYFLDLILVNKYNVDDRLRKKRADYYYRRAMAFKSESQFDLYMFALKQAIRLYPKNVQARMELANYFKANSFPERYIRELEVTARYSDNIDIKDRLEIEKKKSAYRLGEDWKVSQYLVDNDSFKIPLFVSTNIENVHYNFEKIYARLLQNLSYDRKSYEILVYDDRQYDNFEKMKRARDDGSPFYITLYAVEKTNSIEVKLQLSNAANSETIKDYDSFQIGNNRVVLTANSLLRKLDQDIPFKGHILKISGSRALINAGRQSGVKLKDKLLILKKKTYNMEINRSNYIYSGDDIKGTAYVVKVDENISEVIFKDNDFFKDIDIDDIIIYDK